MTRPQGNDEHVERGAAEEMSDAPLTDTEREVSRRPPSASPEVNETEPADAPDGVE
jgi:hypothetical protein